METQTIIFMLGLSFNAKLSKNLKKLEKDTFTMEEVTIAMADSTAEVVSEFAEKNKKEDKEEDSDKDIKQN